MKFQNEIEIQASINDVFEFVADMRNMPKWNYFVTKVTQENGNGPERGVRYYQTRKTDSQRYEIIHYELGQSLIIKTISGSSPMFERHLRFEATANGTRLIDEMTLRTGYPGILERFVVGRIRRAVAENLGKLKKLIEYGQTQLQDGRDIYLASIGGAEAKK
ncbi:SRPBCC family protein [Rhodohalobacter sulfatireducens]|uniref:SRPBCC family protein n=1 Tax=Rhodohalobacter sulfatireducens TaxID=2911366 RepID=A0ABS9KHY0_9BACT|nr:SRPBCC family protein [Rhodohalobacter sulfatireducens]MCG2590462.1 SRPBCC family protein [Rhodohalobacter sulfatireducens]